MAGDGSWLVDLRSALGKRTPSRTEWQLCGWKISSRTMAWNLFLSHALLSLPSLPGLSPALSLASLHWTFRLSFSSFRSFSDYGCNTCRSRILRWYNPLTIDDVDDWNKPEEEDDERTTTTRPNTSYLQ